MNQPVGLKQDWHCTSIRYQVQKWTLSNKTDQMRLHPICTSLLWRECKCTLHDPMKEEWRQCLLFQVVHRSNIGGTVFPSLLLSISLSFYGDGQGACELMKHNTQYQEKLHNYLLGPLRENKVRWRITRNSLASPTHFQSRVLPPLRHTSMWSTVLHLLQRFSRTYEREKCKQNECRK
jgi:hypothetical protein